MSKVVFLSNRPQELGILVWQDFMFGCGQVSRSFVLRDGQSQLRMSSILHMTRSLRT